MVKKEYTLSIHMPAILYKQAIINNQFLFSSLFAVLLILQNSSLPGMAVPPSL